MSLETILGTIEAETAMYIKGMHNPMSAHLTWMNSETGSLY